MSYNISVTFSPDGSDFYLRASSENTTTIEEGGTATLNFTADGTYYQLLKKQASGVAVTGATIDSWACVSPFTSGTLVISNPTSDVAITIIGKQIVSPIELGGPLQISAKAPVDTRMVLTAAQMAEISAGSMPDVYFCVCKDDKKIYVYDKSSSSYQYTPLQVDQTEIYGGNADWEGEE